MCELETKCIVGFMFKLHSDNLLINCSRLLLNKSVRLQENKIYKRIRKRQWTHMVVVLNCILVQLT